MQYLHIFQEKLTAIHLYCLHVCFCWQLCIIIVH